MRHIIYINVIFRFGKLHRRVGMREKLRTMKKILFLILILANVFYATAQTTTLTFTGRDVYNNYIRLDRVLIADFAQNWQETIYYPDTTLTLSITAIEDFANVKEFGLTHNVPNPFDGVSDFCLSLPNEGTVSIEVLSMDGRQIAAYSNNLPMGIHSFRVMLTNPQTYIVTARFKNLSSSIKIVNKGNAGQISLQYTGENQSYATTVPSNEKGQSTNVFHRRDLMAYIGYAVIDGVEYASQMVRQQQQTSEDFVLYFHFQTPEIETCKETPTVTDIDGNVYQTVRIGSQCWMAENLRTTHYPNGDSILLYDYGNGWTTTPFRWYPNNDSSNVGTYGYLYNWRAVMNGEASSDASPSGVQGLCPDGWHVPSSPEWTTLFDYMSNNGQYRCDQYSTTIAKALASTSGWDDFYGVRCAVGNDPSVNNTSGFNALPAGYSGGGGDGSQFGTSAYFWSATQSNDDNADLLQLSYKFPSIIYYPFSKHLPFSVRCLKD